MKACATMSEFLIFHFFKTFYSGQPKSFRQNKSKWEKENCKTRRMTPILLKSKLKQKSYCKSRFFIVQAKVRPRRAK